VLSKKGNQMRQIVLDTETTGLEPSQGHRIIEIGCVEIVNRRVTTNHFHQYIQPDRPVDEGARAVHGISDDFLRDKPRFAAVVDDLLAFVRGAEVIIHNAPFDVGFLDHELRLLGASYGDFVSHCTVTDTLALARRMHPGQKNSLDALCKRYNIDNTHRELHGALLDSQILADVYLAMTGGQSALTFDRGAGADRPATQVSDRLPADRPRLRVVPATGDERAAHEKTLAAIARASGGKCVWQRE
jgi:DNA polymerase-3 subunit epsilon